MIGFLLLFFILFLFNAFICLMIKSFVNKNLFWFLTVYIIYIVTIIYLFSSFINIWFVRLNMYIYLVNDAIKTYNKYE